MKIHVCSLILVAAPGGFWRAAAQTNASLNGAVTDAANPDGPNASGGGVREAWDRRRRRSGRISRATELAGRQST